jgi:dTDP-4-dehydrorhamnose reductase
MKTVIVGSAGQLGQALLQSLPGTLLAMTRADADITDRLATAEFLNAHRPDVVVNCAAYNLVDQAESEPEPAFAVNAWAVRNLAKICRLIDAKLVHVSTDYVFGLERTRATPLTEDDAAGPLSVYGTSKLAGEFMARTFAPRHLIIRTCGLYGRGVGGKGGNFVETMLKLAAAGKDLSVIDDQRLTPSNVTDVAAAMSALIELDAVGLFHVTNAGDCTWHGFAQEIFKQAGVSAKLSATTSARYASPAHRPAYSVLSNAKLHAAGVAPLRVWPDALAAYLKAR